MSQNETNCAMSTHSVTVTDTHLVDASSAIPGTSKQRERAKTLQRKTAEAEGERQTQVAIATGESVRGRRV